MRFIGVALGAVTLMTLLAPSNPVEPAVQQGVIHDAIIRPENRIATRAAAPLSPAFPLEDTFSLHSLPGSSQYIYLDFDGYLLANTAWNGNLVGASYQLVPYNTDGDPANFSANELAEIQDVWLRVSEDFAPFHIDVTTEPPSSTHGTTVAITDDQPLINQCNCGGIAQLYGFAIPFKQPAMDFANGLDTKNVAEIASHEAGHTFGLLHDGSDQAGYATPEYYTGHDPSAWAPIMGAGYYRPLSQWSRGEYAHSNRQQDELAMIAANGAPYRADDHGNSAATATLLTSTSTGIIGRNDVDWFAFNADGGTTLRLAVAPSGPNLDSRLRLYDSSGTLLAGSAPTTAFSTYDIATNLGGGISRALTAGVYYASVEGVGNGDPLGDGYSSYGSLGAYTISVETGAAASPISVSNQTIAARAEKPLNAMLRASGGTAPYTWTSSHLPAGLTLDASGRITGVPKYPGVYKVATTLTDGAASSKRITVIINIADTHAALSIHPPDTTYRHGALIDKRFTARGAYGATTWKVTRGSLPRGLVLRPNGKLRGVARIPGLYPVRIKATDEASRTAVVRLTFRVS